MEKISAAFAMDWSIELDKGLRSKLPGQQIKAIEDFGKRLHQWSIEPVRTKSVLDIYGLVPGEDRTFANTIILRLADAFRNSGNNIRLAILKIFLMEFKHINKKGKSYDGILAKCRVPNHLELLKRIKAVCDSSDVVARSLAFRLLGCWATLSSDSTHIQIVILKGLQSSYNSEVKASLFAAGCFCVFSENFALILMEILKYMLSSGQTPSHLKKPAVQCFGKMGCSPFVASRAYKLGKNLLSDEYLVSMLISLTKLASKSVLLISEQVDFLLSFMSHESPHVKSTVFKCLHTILALEAPVIANGNLLNALLSILDDNTLAFPFQCKVVQMFSKIFCRVSLGLSPCMDIPEFLKLIGVLENMAQSSIKPKKYLVLGVLVDIFCILNNASRGHWWHCPEKWHIAHDGCSQIIPASNGHPPTSLSFLNKESLLPLYLSPVETYPTLLICHIISLIGDHLVCLIKQTNLEFNGKLSSTVDIRLGGEMSKIKQETSRLLTLLLRLSKAYPESIRVSLEKIKYLVEVLVGMCNINILETSVFCEGACQMDVESDADESCVISELIAIICRFVSSCLHQLDELGLIHTSVYQLVELIVNCIEQSDFGRHDIYALFCLRMHFFALCYCSQLERPNLQDQNDPDVWLLRNVCWLHLEFQLLEFIKTLLVKGNFWNAYRAGKYSCCEGAWFAAAFTFKKLMDRSVSESYRIWFRALMLLSGAECQFRLLLFPRAGVELINELQMRNDCEKSLVDPKKKKWLDKCMTGSIIGMLGENCDLRECEGKIARVYSALCSSRESFVTAGVADGFQMWFVSLRAKVLEALLDLLGLLNSHEFPSGLSEADLGRGFQRNTEINFAKLLPKFQLHARSFSDISIRLNKLAKEYDLLLASFFDIDGKSSINLSRLALSCSLLAFSVGFTFAFSGSATCSKFMPGCIGELSPNSFAAVLQDLVVRLSNMDHEVATKLQQCNLLGESVDQLQFTSQKNSSGYKDKVLLMLCEFSLHGILQLGKAANVVKDAADFGSLFLQGRRLLSVVVRKWMEMPFELPKFFFLVRPWIGVGAELFIFNAKAGEDRLVVSPGQGFALNLCLQTKNAEDVVASEMYCILVVKQSDRIVGDGGRGKEEHKHVPSQTWSTEEMLELNELLFHKIKAAGDSPKNKTGRSSLTSGDGDGVAITFVHFKSDTRGHQGFSSCLLDVSAFPVGSYPIKWQSCIVHKDGSFWSPLPLNAGPIFSITS